MEESIDTKEIEIQIKEEFILLLEEKDSSIIKKFLVFGIKNKIISLDEIPSLKLPYSNKISHIESSSQEDTEEKRLQNSKKLESFDLRRELLTKRNESGTNDIDSDENSFSKTNNSTNTNTASKNENHHSNIPLKKIIDEQFNSYCEFLRSGEVEGASFENYLLLHQEMDEYSRIEIGKHKNKKAREIYEKYLMKNAPNKGILNLLSLLFILIFFIFSIISQNPQ